MTNSTTITVSMSTLKLLHKALAYALECSRARAEYESVEEQRWAHESVDFAGSDNADVMTPFWVYREKRRRALEEARLDRAYGRVTDMMFKATCLGPVTREIPF